MTSNMGLWSERRKSKQMTTHTDKAFNRENKRQKSENKVWKNVRQTAFALQLIFIFEVRIIKTAD